MLKRLFTLLFIPVLLVVPAPAFAASVWHVVAPGQTLSFVAAAHGLSVDEIAQWNQIVAPYPLHIDEVLRLTAPPVPLLDWQTRVELVTPAMVNWDPARKCPVAPASLRRVWVSYIDLQGGYHDGSIIVRQDLVPRTQRAFFTLFRSRFRIMAMAPMSVNMPGVTDMSIVTAGYNCRAVAGTSTWSQHAYGTAIDVNPLQNPMFRGVVHPGSLYAARSHYWIGMMHSDGAVRAFTENGFYWGGNWNSLKDYMHFSTTNK